MPVSINSIATRLQTRTVVLPGGRSIVVRALTASETHLVGVELIPRPVPPWGRDPAKGTSAPPVLREDDPDHQRRLRIWLEALKCAEVAIAADLATSDGDCWSAQTDNQRRAAWLAKVRAELQAALTDAEITQLWEAVRIAGDAGQIESALGN